jgi:hypothetical protein
MQITKQPYYIPEAYLALEEAAETLGFDNPLIPQRRGLNQRGIRLILRTLVEAYIYLEYGQSIMGKMFQLPITILWRFHEFGRDSTPL